MPTMNLTQEKLKTEPEKTSAKQKFRTNIQTATVCAICEGNCENVVNCKKFIDSDYNARWELIKGVNYVCVRLTACFRSVISEEQHGFF